ncbi:selenoneine biosynthesis selenosugar synthase SenB [Thioalkalivibrio paradoxus]|uniref:Glycosyl transferase family 1 n=1 Tax=Thioalkalivibrio paradoxus ARh 1 TaxID=713585 RepID=W0DHB5_9GAMM|nr:selenoneine biosynthesis selenosugar synthase SenB [Thioalkalivibrio paradoxus]AHE97796.1 glycosyl transferase family 1 [Thioalkalivibrio paradoxus ARh 1]
MRIHLITPSPSPSRGGNWTTAARWARILRGLGHRVRVARTYRGEAADLMVALHAWRSADWIAGFADRHPSRPLVVALTGTDAYRFIHSHPEPTLRSLELADRLVGLHDRIGDVLPPEQIGKLRVIYQSAPPGLPRDPYRRGFRVCVAGHLREEKDPLRPALALRGLPTASRLRVDHYGGAHSPDWADAARAEMAANPRYRWHGEVPHYRLRRVFARSQLLVLPSRMEGGANVISEAVMAGLPVIASRIAGSVGLLGDDHPGYYPVADTGALRALLLRAESDKQFLQMLERACAACRPRFKPRREHRAWEALLRDIGC